MLSHKKNKKPVNFTLPYPSTLLQTARRPASSPFSGSLWESPTRPVPTAAVPPSAHTGRTAAGTTRPMNLHNETLVEPLDSGHCVFVCASVNFRSYRLCKPSVWMNRWKLMNVTVEVFKPPI